MLNKVVKLLLVSTSLAPIFLTLWFLEFSKEWNIRNGFWYIVATIFLTGLCLGIMNLSKNHLQQMPIKMQSISTADKEILGFILIYLLPLINNSSFQVNIKILIFIMALFFISVLTTNSYHFNPVLGFLGYHFYEVTIDGGITYVLITKRNLTNTKSIKQVVQLTEYMILEVEEDTKR